MMPRATYVPTPGGFIRIDRSPGARARYDVKVGRFPSNPTGRRSNGETTGG